MSTHPAHVAAVAEALAGAFLPNVAPAGVIERLAPAAVETLTPLIEADLRDGIGTVRVRAEYAWPAELNVGGIDLGEESTVNGVLEAARQSQAGAS